MLRGLSYKSVRQALLSLALFAAITIECRPVELFDGLVSEENDFTTIKLPGIDDFRQGLDYSTGKRKKSIFKFTYTHADAGESSHLHSEPLDAMIYKIPDQVDAMDWASVCSTFSSIESSSHSTFRSYQETASRSSHSEYDQKTDIGVSVPAGPAEVSMSTQTRNNLGYGTSSASSDYSSAMVSGQRTAASVTTFNARWGVQWKAYDSNLQPMLPANHLTDDFTGSVRNLEDLCGSVDMQWRMAGHSGTGSSSCEQTAARLVEDFGTHYNNRAQYGGKASQSYFYNEDQMTTSQKTSMESTSKFSMGFLFFMHNEDTTEAREEIVSMESKNVASESKLEIIGGDAGAETAGSWCNTVSKAPTIIGNSRIVPIADLIDNGNAKAAAVFAGMDKWVCNGRGSYVNINQATGSGSCQCQSDHDFNLDEFCAPQSPKCYDGSQEVPCRFEKILATYALSYSLLWNDQGSGGSYDGSLYKPIVAANKALVGTTAVKGYSPPTKPVITIDTSTSYEVARPAESFFKVWGDHGTGSSRDGSVWRPTCRAGYTSVSDFGQNGYNWPNDYREPLLPCIASRCVKKCYVQWVWNDKSTGGSTDTTWWRLAGTSAELGSDVGRSGGFFRGITSYNEPIYSLQMCINPDCVLVV